MNGRRRRGAFTIIELLVVLTIILVLAGLLLTGIQAARRAVNRAKCQTEITNMMMALQEYFAAFNDYPHGLNDNGGTDVGDDGNLDNDAGDDVGAGKVPADPNHPTIAELQLCTIITKLTIENGSRTVGPYYNPNRVQVVNGAMRDVYGSSYRYLADGRRTTLSGGQRMLSRIFKKGPVIWSIGEDLKQDVKNDNVDNDNNGKVDDPPELVNDVCSWN
jgi:prepilin-type N-terminal cleavage/methylation domain-containing protein